MAKSANAEDLKSFALGLVGSSPTTRTKRDKSCILKAMDTNIPITGSSAERKTAGVKQQLKIPHT